MPWLKKILSVLFEPPDPAPQQPAITVKDLKEYKGRLYNALSRDIADFEKNFLLISAGTLAFSITFIKEIVKLQAATWLSLLYISWLLIAASVAVMMFTFISSAYASDKIWLTIDQFQVDRKLHQDDENIDRAAFFALRDQTNAMLQRSKHALKGMRFSAIALFFAGIGALGCFTGINTWKENHQAASGQSTVTIEVDPKSRVMKINGVELIQEDSTILLKANPNKK